MRPIALAQPPLDRRPAYPSFAGSSPLTPLSGLIGRTGERPKGFRRGKHDGFRLIVQREGKLLTRRGYDRADRYPLITQTALRLRKSSFVINGEGRGFGPR